MGQKGSKRRKGDISRNSGGVDRLKSPLDLVELEQSLRQHPAGKANQADHAWDPNGCSPNIRLTGDDCIAKKLESRVSSVTTDMVRGKRGYTRGTHIWEITWKKEHRGSHAVIGVASYSAPLQGLGQTALLGSNDESIGWDIVSNVSLFNDCVINEYPGNVQLGFQAPDVIRVILHMDEGSLRFKSGIDGTDYGHCLSGLRAFSRNGQKLYPAISMTKQGAEIGIKYLGSAEPIYDVVGGTSEATSGPVVFHSEVGANVELSNGRSTATRTRGNSNGVVMSNRPLKVDEYFGVKLVKTEELPTNYVIDVGVTTNSPEKLNFPETMTECKQEQTWMMCGSRLVLNKQPVESFTKMNLDDLKEGSAVGLMRSADGQLHIFLNGCLKVKCDLKLPPNIYAVVDMFGKGCEVTIVDLAQSSPSKRSSGGDAAGSPVRSIAPKSTVEVITEKVQATISLLKEKDQREISKVQAALTTDVLEVYDSLSIPLQQMLGDRFKNMDGATAIADYMAFLEDSDLENEEVQRCYFECFNVLLNLTHSSFNFASALAETRAFAMIVMETGKLRTRYRSNKDNAQRVVYALGVLHNCSIVAANVSALRKSGAKDVLVEYCDPVEHDSSIAFVALLTLVNIMVGFEVESLEVHDNMLATIVKYTAAAVANADDHYASVIFAMAKLSILFHSTEQVAAVCKLGQNAVCRVSLVEKKVTEPLVRLMEIGDRTEQEVACNAVWELLSEKTVEEVIMSPRLTDVVGKLRDADVKEVADAAKRLNVKIKQILRRSRVGGIAQQVMPSNTTLSRACEYKDVCQRYVKQLNIPDMAMISNCRSSSASDCHSAKEEDNYYTRGEPPKEYGIPVGWYRFGIQVVERHKNRFDKWHRAFHGTKADTVAKILDIGDLLMPGDKPRGGDKIRERPEHFDDDWKPEGFKTKQVFVSPSIRYAGHHSYATPTKYVDEETNATYNSQVALQVLIAPESYTVGEATVGGTHAFDPKFSNQEIEWATEERGSVTLYGLLVKLEEKTGQIV
ncbi:SPRY domain-containing SOCS box protein 2 [Lamellibrachia satsuma]|nr:SPRY domain-containing SOCS box protein 2 [Lamellibrachia satsuma]